MHQYISLWATSVYFVTILNVQMVPSKESKISKNVKNHSQQRLRLQIIAVADQKLRSTSRDKQCCESMRAWMTKRALLECTQLRRMRESSAIAEDFTLTRNCLRNMCKWDECGGGRNFSTIMSRTRECSTVTIELLDSSSDCFFLTNAESEGIKNTNFDH